MGAKKAVSEFLIIAFLFTFQKYLLFPISKRRVILVNLSKRTRTTVKLKTSLISFFKQNSMSRSGVNFPTFVFLELIEVAKYGCVRAK